MIDYFVRSSKEGLVIEGDFPPNLTLAALPSDYKPRKRYVSYFLHKNDIEVGIALLRCISIDKIDIINEGLFIAGLNAFIKCFQDSKARNKVNVSKFAKEKHIKDNFEYFNAMRNKHYMHDENGMLQVSDFLMVDFDKEKPSIYNASVVWNRIRLDYHMEAAKLLYLMNELHRFLCSEIDKMNNNIIKDFSGKSKEELMENGIPNIKVATIDKPYEER